MPRSSGIYTPTSGTWTNGASNGVLANLTDWQALLNDLVDAISQSVSKDGQTTMTGDLPMGGFKLTGLGAGTGTGQTLTFEQLFSQGTEADIASAATTDIGLQNSNFLRITGNTTISSFGTNYRGPRFLRFAGAVTLTNSSTLILPGGADFTTSAGNVLVAIPKATAGVADGWYIVSLPADLSTYVTLTGTQTLTNKTLTSPTLTGTILNDGYTEEVYNLTGTAIDAANGSIQYKTLSGNTTFTEALADGQSVVLMLNPSTFAVTWPGGIAWIGNVASTAPTLVASVYNCITLFQITGTVYGKFEGRV
jgi:hypothetical protein